MADKLITIVCDPGEQATADLISGACTAALERVYESWGSGAPEDCRIYVMTSWLGFVFRSAPWPWRILLAISLPFWGFRARRTWPYSAAWTLRYGKRVAIGVKPPRLLEQSDKRFGARMFVEEKDLPTNIRRVTCHELTHACTAPPPAYRTLAHMSGEDFVYHAVRGYGLVELIEDRCPRFLKHKLSRGWQANSIEREIAIELGLKPDNFWKEIDAAVVDHFGAATA